MTPIDLQYARDAMASFVTHYPHHALRLGAYPTPDALCRELSEVQEVYDTRVPWRVLVGEWQSVCALAADEHTPFAALLTLSDIPHCCVPQVTGGADWSVSQVWEVVADPEDPSVEEYNVRDFITWDSEDPTVFYSVSKERTETDAWDAAYPGGIRENAELTPAEVITWLTGDSPLHTWARIVADVPAWFRLWQEV